MSEAAIDARSKLCADPSDAGSLYMSGVEAFRGGEIDVAVRRWQRTLASAPESLSARIDLAACLIDRGRDFEAWRTLAPAIVMDVSLAESWGNLGALLLRMGRPIDATRAFARANACRPADASWLSGLSAAALRSGLIALSLRASHRAAALVPDLTAAWYNRGLALEAGGAFGVAEQAIGRVCALAPDDAEARFARALAWLRRGDFLGGFREYEWRRHIRRFEMPNAPRTAKPWNGEKDPKATLVVRCEQGAGDSIQFARFIEQARDRVGRLVISCGSGLTELLSTVRGVDEVVGNDEGDGDYWTPLLSLPRILGVTLAELPAKVPYLGVDAARREHWRRRVSTGPGMRVGIAWQGNPTQANEPARSPSLRAILPILGVAGCRFFSLQVGPGREQLGDAPPSLRIDDLGPELKTFADTAAAIEALDLVIAPCTALTHLAGALGRPVWVMLMRGADWRWHESGDASPWYPSARVFQQTRAGDWAEVAARIAAELQAASRSYLPAG